MSEPAALPSNLDAEQALLGILMFDNSAYERLPDGLRGEHFYEPFHQRLFAAVADAVVSGRSADPTILMTGFAQDAAFEQFGGLRYLADLVDRAPPSANARHYADTIMDLAIRRDLIRVGGELIANAPLADKSGRDHLAEAEGVLFALAEQGETAKAVATFSDALEGALEQAEAAFNRDGGLSGIPTGLVDLDQKLGGLHPSDLLILAGRPSIGKTALALNITVNAARAGARVFFSSLEMSKEQLASRAIAELSGVSGDRIRKGQITADELRRMHEVARDYRKLPIHIDETGGINIAKLCARARRHQRKHGIDLLVIDYLQLITTDNGRGGNRVQEVTQITTALKALAKELGVPVLALSQLSRQVENREDKRPQLSDLRESGSIEQDADVVMFVYRESYYLGRSEPKEGSQAHLDWQDAMAQAKGKAEVIIGKQRHGPIGTVHLAFDEDLTKFGNLAREQDRSRAAAYGFGGYE